MQTLLLILLIPFLFVRNYWLCVSLGVLCGLIQGAWSTFSISTKCLLLIIKTKSKKQWDMIYDWTAHTAHSVWLHLLSFFPRSKRKLWVLVFLKLLLQIQLYTHFQIHYLPSLLFVHSILFYFLIALCWNSVSDVSIPLSWYMVWLCYMACKKWFNRCCSQSISAGFEGSSW